MTAPIVFLDTETDGVHPGRKVWEVAMIRRDDKGERETQFFVDIDLKTADPFGLKVGRFYERHPMGRRLSGLDDVDPFGGDSSCLESWAAFEVARWTHGAHIVGMVPNFDTEVLANLLRSEHLTPAWHYHLIDVENLAVGWLYRQADARDAEVVAFRAERPDADPWEEPWGGGSLRAVATPPWDSEEISAAIDVEPPSDEDRHTAMGDARWCQRIYDRITGGTK
ncbi:hypothetical protein [Nocardia wallacei]|uniref:hypothetical protein n=1 Tax=Nocardia wallacei TaxID=480035 RepID=UPI002455415A|nr:hypothetical protein [Nocardia wallacei]